MTKKDRIRCYLHSASASAIFSDLQFADLVDVSLKFLDATESWVVEGLGARRLIFLDAFLAVRQGLSGTRSSALQPLIFRNLSSQ